MQQHVYRVLGVGGAFDEMAVYVPGATNAKGGGQQRRTIISMVSMSRNIISKHIHFNEQNNVNAQ